MDARDFGNASDRCPGFSRIRRTLFQFSAGVFLKTERICGIRLGDLRFCPLVEVPFRCLATA